MKLPTLTLHEPWASLIAAGVKTIETRGWQTGLRGPLVIHAAARRVDHALVVGDWQCFRGRTPVDDRIHYIGSDPLPAGRSDVMRPWYRRVVAAAVLDDCVRMHGLDGRPNDRACIGESRQEPGRWYLWTPTRAIVADAAGVSSRLDFDAYEVTDQVPYGRFEPGRYAWMLSNVREVEQLSCAFCCGYGRLGLAAGFEQTDDRPAWPLCPVCKGTGVGDLPRVAVGRQGLWHWDPETSAS